MFSLTSCFISPRPLQLSEFFKDEMIIANTLHIENFILMKGLAIVEDKK
ncbi:hypothetical protein Bsph_0431 [Lysinibacillus sphaericus C3-41]|uniref:Uncharacterized protein n=1 Tax=Lysinibacillus sphaericus (strain C3-41) TaxID=444177 RepID=B1HVN9_LYSSC|nr:hypothetical protein Bsph_0431 [Lysinibacillus sphaericus C3-41]